MSDKVSIAELRGWAESNPSGSVLLSRRLARDVLALVEAVEAADELRLFQPGRKGDAAARRRLFARVDRFDFGGRDTDTKERT